MEFLRLAVAAQRSGAMMSILPSSWVRWTFLVPLGRQGFGFGVEGRWTGGGAGGVPAPSSRARRVRGALPYRLVVDIRDWFHRHRYSRNSVYVEDGRWVACGWDFVVEGQGGEDSSIAFIAIIVKCTTFRGYLKILCEISI